MASNNTFRKATDLGSFSTTKVLRTKDAIGSTDKADVFKFTVEPTLAFRASSAFKSKGGALTVSFFVLNPLTNKPTATVAPAVIKAGKTAAAFEFPATNVPLTFFVKFDKPTQDVGYRFTLKPIATV
jgi:hypothetical protein